MYKPYRAADAAMAALRKLAVRRFSQARREAALCAFDELNVIKIMGTLYDALRRDNEQQFLAIARRVYRESGGRRKAPDKSWVYALLAEYDTVTRYRYRNEVRRKQEYAQEAVLSSAAKRQEFDRALLYWSRMTAHYADEVEYRAALKAFKDAGVRRVRWRTREDEKVCHTCGPRDGKTYDIQKVPRKPHWGCRCWLEGVK